jgi:hypothetical protein
MAAVGGGGERHEGRKSSGNRRASFGKVVI